MNISKISIQNIRHKPLSSFLSILLLAFGTGIIVLLLSASEQLDKQFKRNIRGIDMVAGAKGSPLQLILSGVYHIDAPTGNIPLAEFEKLVKNPMVEKAIPLAYGDNYKGYRIVGTEKSYPEHYEAELTQGGWWQKTGDVVLGASVAELKSLQIGDTFHGSHGLENAMDEHADFDYEVVGIMEPTGTVIDKLILTGMESVWAVHGHEEEGENSGNHQGESPPPARSSPPPPAGESAHNQNSANEEGHQHKDEEHSHEEHREITVGLLSFKNAMGNFTIPRMVNQNTSMQAALPAIEINRLFSLMGTGVKTLQALAILIVIISAISVFVSLYQSLKERKFELSLMRTMGAGSGQLLWIILLEGIIISFIGYLCGLILGKLGIYLMAQLAQDSYQYSFEIPLVTQEELFLLPIVLAIGFLAALLPAVQAYRLNISKVLSDA